jgi:agmatine deiminase
MLFRYVFCLCFCSSFLHAQEVCLPRYLTRAERQMIANAPTNEQFGPNEGVFHAPTSPLRAPAEWEEIQTLVVAWTSYEAILAEIVRHARLECNVMVCVKNATAETSARNYLTSKGVDMSSNVQFVVRDFNTVWVRDYGPNACYTNDIDSLVLVDWKYNRPRPKDDTLSYKIAETMQLPLYKTLSAPDYLIHTGGNFMTDGNGLGFSSKLVLHENGPNTSNLQEADIDAIMSKYHGLQRYVKLDTLPYDGIHHIDMHMKLINEETLLMGQYPQGIADGPQIEANLQYILAQYRNMYDRPFDVVRVPMPPEGGQYPNTSGDYRTYANAIFVNKTVLVPVYEPAFDSVALEIWRKALPGYKIVGINCNSIITALGALHCITKEIGAHDPIWITYPQMDDVVDNTAQLGYLLVAKAKHKHGFAEVNLHYRLSTETVWNSVPMTSFSSQIDHYGAVIPHLPDGSLVHYYVEAIGNTGKKVAKPLPAPEAFYSFRIGVSTSTHQIAMPRMEAAYPNPASATTCVPIVNPGKAYGRIAINDPSGREMLCLYEGEINAGPNNYFFNAKNLANGLYFLVFETAETKLAQKILVAR